jgi:hypothetical protein
MRKENIKSDSNNNIKDLNKNNNKTFQNIEEQHDINEKNY